MENNRWTQSTIWSPEYQQLHKLEPLKNTDVGFKKDHKDRHPQILMAGGSRGNKTDTRKDRTFTR